MAAPSAGVRGAGLVAVWDAVVREAVTALAQAKLAVDEATQALLSAAGGSGQDDIQQA